MNHPGSAVHRQGTKLPPFELNARQRDFISDALHTAGVSRLQRDGICLTLAAVHNIRPDQRSSGRPEGDGWKLVSIYGLAQRRDLSERAIRRHLTSMAKAGLMQKASYLGPRAGIWVRYATLSEILPPPKGATSSTTSSTISSDLFEAGTGVSPSSINSGDSGDERTRTPLTPQRGERAGGGGEITKPKSRRGGSHALPPELQPYADRAFDALKANGMRQGRDRFDAVIASTPAGFTPGEIKQALINLASSTLATITPDMWAKQLRATQRPGGTLQPFKFDWTPAELERRRQQAARAEAVRSADQELALQSTSAPSPASAPETETPDLSQWQDFVTSRLQMSKGRSVAAFVLREAIPEALRRHVTISQINEFVASGMNTSTPSPALHPETPLEGPTTPLQVDPAAPAPASPPEPHSSLRERRCTAAIQKTAAADYLSGRPPTPAHDLLAAIS